MPKSRKIPPTCLDGSLVVIEGAEVEKIPTNESLPRWWWMRVPMSRQDSLVVNGDAVVEKRPPTRLDSSLVVDEGTRTRWC